MWTLMCTWVLAEMFVSKNDRFICSDGGPLLVLFICHLWVILDGKQLKNIRCGKIREGS